MKCPYRNECCLCANCTDNAKYDDCVSGYCINCYECEEAQKVVYNIYICTGYNPIKKCGVV